MTEPIPATPGWVDGELDRAFAGLPDSLAPARAAFAECLAGRKAPAAPSDNLGAEFEPCHRALRRALEAAEIEPGRVDAILSHLEAFEAEIAARS